MFFLILFRNCELAAFFFLGNKQTSLPTLSKLCFVQTLFCARKQSSTSDPQIEILSNWDPKDQSGCLSKTAGIKFWFRNAVITHIGYEYSSPEQLSASVLIHNQMEVKVEREIIMIDTIHKDLTVFVERRISTSNNKILASNISWKELIII